MAAGGGVSAGLLPVWLPDRLLLPHCLLLLGPLLVLLLLPGPLRHPPQASPQRVPLLPEEGGHAPLHHLLPQ